ncbi:hypothetical protein NDU88_000518 [Pleurodeles waltl]|uniref:Uncharacterized protein n=1 Tax=Pleurodeles waltl TaxID=8319 RepID=A0AAV7TFC0_PLEWA|nr:hypothetical protein NDU88_000518 [Pleurodeles waltl]
MARIACLVQADTSVMVNAPGHVRVDSHNTEEKESVPGSNSLHSSASGFFTSGSGFLDLPQAQSEVRQPTSQGHCYEYEMLARGLSLAVSAFSGILVLNEDQ